jgi:hypothetical protein
MKGIMRAPKKWYLKERDNPQLGTYWVKCGQMSKTAAKRKESSLYGFNIMHGFDSESEYNAKIEELKKGGERVQ